MLTLLLTGTLALAAASDATLAIVARDVDAAVAGALASSDVVTARYRVEPADAVAAALAEVSRDGLQCDSGDVACWQKLAIACGFAAVLIAAPSSAGPTDLTLTLVDAHGAPRTSTGPRDRLAAVVDALWTPTVPAPTPAEPPPQPQPAPAAAPSAPTKPAASPSAPVPAASTSDARVPLLTLVGGGVAAVSVVGASAASSIILLHPPGYTYADHYVPLSAATIVLSTTTVLAGVAAAAAFVLDDGAGASP